MKKKTKNRFTLFSIFCITLSTMSFPITTVYSETYRAGVTELLEFESIIPDIDSNQQEAPELIAQEEIQEFSFSVKTFQVAAGQIFDLPFTSKFSASEVNIRVPEAAEVVQERLPENISVFHQKGEYWTIQSETALTEYAIPIVFSAVGGYFISIDNDADHFYVEVSEAAAEIAERTETIEEIIPAMEKNLSIDQQLIDEEIARVYEQTLDLTTRNTSNVSNWSEFRSAWNSSSTTRINMNTNIQYSSSILGDRLNTRSSTIEIGGSNSFNQLSLLNSGYSLIMSGGADLSLNNITIVDFPGGALSRDDRTQPFIMHQGTGAINVHDITIQMRTGTASSTISGRNINLSGRVNITSFPLSGTTANMNASAIHVMDGTLKISNIEGTNSFISSTVNARSSLKPITSTAGSKIEILGNRVSMAEAIELTTNRTTVHYSWNTVDVILTGLNGSQVERSVSSPNNFNEIYTSIFDRSDYNSLIFGASGGLWVEPPPVQGSVFVRHLNRLGNEIATRETLTGNVGTPYTTRSLSIEGYRLSSQPSNASGVFREQDITVDYIYDQIEYGTVTVNYLDEEDNQLAEPETLTGELGTNYAAPEKTIDDYELIERPDNASGTFSKENITVDFIYREIPNIGSIEVRHIDKRGNELVPSQVIEGRIGHEYNTSPEEIEGYYSLVQPSNKSGNFTHTPQTITYEYVQIHPTLLNPSFEEPSIGTKASEMVPQAEVKGWYTTASDKMIEFGTGPSHNIGSARDGNQFVELNANEEGALFQLVSFDPGTKLRWILYHAGRNGVDTMELEVGAPDNPESISRMESPRGSWSRYSGTYVVPENQFVTYFGFKSINSSSGSRTMGNLLDHIHLAEKSDLNLKNKVDKESAYPGDSLIYTVDIENDGGVPADRIELEVTDLDHVEVDISSIMLDGRPVNSSNISYEGNRLVVRLDRLEEDTHTEMQYTAVINRNFHRGEIQNKVAASYWDEHFNDEQYFSESNTVSTIVNATQPTPVDPMDPDQEIEPENPPTLPEDQGLISIDFVSQFNFGEVAIRAGETAYGAMPQRVLNENGTVSEEKRPNFVQISDRRPESERGGWTLSATLAQSGFQNEKNERLVGAQISLHNQALATSRSNSESPSPRLTQSIPALIPGVKRNLLEADLTEGKGTWIYRFGDMETMDNSVMLDLPAGANPKADRYEATIDWELSIVPGND